MKHERNKPLRSNSLTTDLLLDIARAADDIHFGLLRPGMVVRYGIEDARKILSRQEIRERKQKLYQLHERGLIHAEKINKKYEIQFKKYGCIEVQRQRILKEKTYLPQNTLCIVSFDIPEKYRKVRQQTSRLLGSLGMRRTHRSVWSSNQDIVNNLKKLLLLRGVKQDWFKIFIGKQI